MLYLKLALYFDSLVFNIQRNIKRNRSATGKRRQKIGISGNSSQFKSHLLFRWSVVAEDACFAIKFQKLSNFCLIQIWQNLKTHPN